jgi:hypothetical protein
MRATYDWKVNKNGQSYTSRLVNLLGRYPAADLNSDGPELEEKFRTGHSEAETRAEEAKNQKNASEKVI